MEGAGLHVFLNDSVCAGSRYHRPPARCLAFSRVATVFPGIAVQRCWAHKIRNVIGKVKKADQPVVKRALHKIMNAPTPQPPPRSGPVAAKQR